MSPETSWWLPTNHKSLSNPLLYSRTNCLQSVKIGQVPSLPLRRQTGFAKQQTANTSGTNLEIGNDFIWAERESVTSDGGAPGERDVTTSHQTARTSDNAHGLAETNLLVNDVAFAFTEIFEQHLCVTK